MSDKNKIEKDDYGYIYTKYPGEKTHCSPQPTNPLSVSIRTIVES